MSTLINYINCIEEVLIAKYKASKNLGHPVNLGLCREYFIKEFLEQYLNETVSIGSGEIVEANSAVGDKRNQHDVVIYKNNYPKLPFGGVDAFFVESVVCTIEIKSKLTKKEFVKAVKVGRKAKLHQKNSKRHMQTGNKPPQILSFILAYDGPKNMETVLSWLEEYYKNEGLTDKECIWGGGKTIDGIFILRKGFAFIDNLFSFGREQQVNPYREIQWEYVNSKNGNLLTFFYILTDITSYLEVAQLDPKAYLEKFQPQVKIKVI